MHHTLGNAVTRRGSRRGSVAAIAVVALALAACSSSGSGTASSDSTSTSSASGDADPLGAVHEATGDPIKIGFVATGSNAAGDNQVELDAADATVKYLNMYKGGIDGRPIELVTCITNNDPAKATDCSNQMVAAGVPLVALGASGSYDSSWQPLHAANIASVFFAAAGETILADATTTFSFVSPTLSNVEFPISIAKKDGKKKVTAIVIDVPPAVQSLEGTAADAYEAAGIDLELVRVPVGTADMTPQLQAALSGDPGVVHIVGNDTFCISALQAMQSLGYSGPVTVISFCLSDATRQAFPGGYLKGVNVALTGPIGDGAATQLYRAVVAKFGGGKIDVTKEGGSSMFSLFAGIQASLAGLKGDVTAASVIAALHSMPDTELPGGGGIHIKCDGKAVPAMPAACTKDGLYTVLDASGNPTDVEATK
jgi:ABC-type branched-subunit amino acid transport system substrate-binding protein